MQEQAIAWRHAGDDIGVVPTMGALHAGHDSLVASARRENQRVIVTVFVNPAQFGPNEDFARYPRPFDEDRAPRQSTRSTRPPSRPGSIRAPLRRSSRDGAGPATSPAS